MCNVPFLFYCMLCRIYCFIISFFNVNSTIELQRHIKPSYILYAIYLQCPGRTTPQSPGIRGEVTSNYILSGVLSTLMLYGLTCRNPPVGKSHRDRICTGFYRKHWQINSCLLSAYFSIVKLSFNG